MREKAYLSDAKRGHATFAALWQCAKGWLEAGKSVTVEIRTDTRSLAQSRLMFSCLTDLSRQVVWFGRHLSPEGWKDFITAHLAGQDVVPNMDGTGFVTLGRGKSTSDMTIAEMVAVIDLCHAFGDLREVKWSKTSLGRDWPDEATTAAPESAAA